MLSNIWNIWTKELMDTIRDKKAFRQALLVPLVVGVGYAVINPLLTSTVAAQAEAPLSVPTIGLEHADDQLEFVFAQLAITFEPFEGDLHQAVASGREAAGLIIPEGFSQNVSAQQPAQLELLVNPTAGGLFGSSGQFALRRLQAAMIAYNGAVAGGRLQQENLDPSLLVAATLDAQDLSTPAQRAGIFASFMLPILVGLLVVQGGLFIAIDVTAGEKERNTLEALLVTPTRDVEVFLGKLFAVFTMSTIPLMITLLGYWGASNLLPESMTNGAVLPLSMVAYTVLLTLPLALFINVILMIISIRTKTYKDAQSSIVPVSLTVVFTAMAGGFVPPTSSWMHLIPVYGTSSVVGKLALGAGAPWDAIGFSIAGALLATVIGVAFALKLFNRERLLYSA